MKSPRFLLLFAVCTLAGFWPAAARAFDIPTFDFGNNAPMPAAVVQLYTDLNGIAPGTAATDTQHQALVADLNALATGIFTPDPADIDQLATDLGTAATNGLFSDNVLEYLADDFIGAPGDPDIDPDGWMDDIQDDVSSLIDPPPSVIDPGDPTLGDPTAVPDDGVIYELGATAVASADEARTRMSVQLQAQGIPQGLLENYSGQVHLLTRTFAGGTTANTLRVRTLGLPPSNPYTVSITRRSDGVSVTLGKLHVRNALTLLPVAFTSSVVAGAQAEILTNGDAAFGGKNLKKPLPTGFDAADVATVTVTDSQGVVRLTGSIADGTSTTQSQTLNLHLSGPAVASALPSATVTARHKITSAGLGVRFYLSAHHLPASTPVMLLADGVSVGQFTTTAKGRLIVMEGPIQRETNSLHGSHAVNALPNDEDLSGAKSFTLTDAQGVVLLNGSLD